MRTRIACTGHVRESLYAPSDIVKEKAEVSIPSNAEMPAIRGARHQCEGIVLAPKPRGSRIGRLPLTIFCCRHSGSRTMAVGGTVFAILDPPHRLWRGGAACSFGVAATAETSERNTALHRSPCFARTAHTDPGTPVPPA